MTATLDEQFEAHHEVMKSTKERLEEDEDLSIFIIPIRDGEMVGTFTANDRDNALKACRIIAAGMEPEALFFTFEGWWTENTINPDTDEQWRSGEMEAFVKAHPDTDVIGEGLNSHMATRDSETDKSMFTLFTREGDKIVWKETHKATAQAGGFVYDQLRFAMDQELLSKQMLRQSGVDIGAQMEASLGYEERWFHQDMGVLRMLFDNALLTGGMLAIEQGTKREELFRERFGDEEMAEARLDFDQQ